MDEESKKYLLGIVSACKNGEVDSFDAAWRFLVEIADSNDYSLFELATPEIQAEMIEKVNCLRRDGVYIALIFHVGELDETARVKKFESLMIEGGYLKP